MNRITRILVVATALAIPVSAVHLTATAPNAEAAGRKGMRTAKVVKVKVTKPRRAFRAKRVVRVASYKSCGTFMYRKGGKCMDARAKK